MQNEQLTFKNIFTYEADQLKQNQLKTKPKASFAKSTETDAK